MERRVVIVDDSRTIQAILDNAFSSRADFRVVGFAADAATAPELIRRLMPDIVTIDFCMPYLDGEALLALINDLPSVCKIIVSDKAVENRLLYSRLLQAGASVCLAKRDLVENPDLFFKQVKSAANKVRARRHHLSTFGGDMTTMPTAAEPTSATVIPFPVPADERHRLIVGERKLLFDAKREPCFDLVTKNAAKLTAFPVSLLTFIDRDTQWVKSSFGLPVEHTPRDQAFCNYTISQGGAFVVSNAATDERFSAHPLVTNAPNIKTYTGLPVITSDGVTVGSLCVIDSRVRSVSKHALDQLAALAEIVAAMIDLRPARAA
ncbi:MAG: sensor phosphodiesterase [Sphingomonas bacterium]|uniref:response regulator n=1 Tax=Sphingomonas bacterium TaxID=1895847 RepID=UPI0026040144|nr:response regulator [Sphingomonas bacterium]MDB5695152.1 sensor phosphodiesterase [Sphingomonas bacterium]